MRHSKSEKRFCSPLLAVPWENTNLEYLELSDGEARMDVSHACDTTGDCPANKGTGPSLQ